MKYWGITILNFVPLTGILESIGHNINAITGIVLALLGLFEASKKIYRWFRPTK